MNETLQTKFNNDGNCLAACITTILGGNIDDVPFYDLEDSFWAVKLSKWMREKYKKFIVCCRFDEVSGNDVLGDSLSIVSIESDNPDVDRHAVIVRKNKIVFDPMVGKVDIKLKKSMDPVFLILGNVIE